MMGIQVRCVYFCRWFTQEQPLDRMLTDALSLFLVAVVTDWSRLIQVIRPGGMAIGIPSAYLLM